MAEMQWNEGQLEAINSTSKGTVVSAAAGSGKTAVLIERTIRMLLNPELKIDADSLLAVTFTNDAANQMKQKLDEAMRKKLEQGPSDRWIARQQELLPLSSICTIDSFCMDLVRNNINEFDLSADFSIIDSVENQVLTQKAFGEACEWYLENKPQEMKTLMANFTEETDAELIETAMELHDFKGSLAFPEQWKKLRFDSMKSVAAQFVTEVREKNVLNARFAAKNSDKILELSESIANSKYHEYVQAVKKFADEVCGHDGDNTDKSVLAAAAAVSAVKFPRRPNKSKTTPQINEVYDNITAAKKAVSTFVDEILSAPLLTDEEIDRDFAATKDIFSLLWDFVSKAEEILREYKIEKNKAYFSDVTHMAISLVAKPLDEGFERTELAKKIVEQKLYRMILIDEYQDVNDLQDIIFRCISDTDDLSVPGRNLFIVGDIKQSIYGFRQSNPMIFERTRRLANEASHQDKLKSVLLKTNYRSRANIIDFTNFIFDKVMSQQIGDVTYDENEALVCGAAFSGDNPATDIILIDDAKDGEDREGESADTECVAVAKKIRSMIESGYKVSDKNGGMRPCLPGDFCVLLRTSKKIQPYIKAMEKEGLAAVTDSVSGYLGAREVSLAVSMLKIIDNPMQDIPFAAVCLSSVFGFSADEMSYLRLIDRHKKLYQIFLAVSRDEEDEDYGYQAVKIDDEQLREKCINTISVISKLRFFASGMSLERLVRKIYDTTDFMSVAAAFEDSRQKRANLRLLIKLAADYEASTGGGLSDFLRYLDSVSRSGKDFEEALTVSPSAKTVMIKTIHKSKGLEYPIVILGDCAKEYNISNAPGKLICSERVGAAVTLRDRSPKLNRKTVFYNYLNDLLVKEQLSEELRILYVALTRAREKLIIPLNFKTKGKNRIKKAAAALSDRGKPSYLDVTDMRSYAEILAYALLCHHDRSELCDFIGIDANGFPEMDIDKKVAVLYERFDGGVTDEESEPVRPKQPVDIALFGRITENLALREDSADTNTLSKLTVTEFVREMTDGDAHKEITFLPQIPDFANQKGKVLAADRGTYTHLFMELCDFSSAQADVGKEIEKLVRHNKLSALQAENIDVDSIKGFFASDLYKRCQLAKSLMREQKFMVRLSDMKVKSNLFGEYNNKDVMVQGIADLIIEEEDGLVIVDYKTDNVKEASELVSRHSLQLALYKAAFELVLNKKVKECYIYSFKLRQPIKVDA